MDKRDGEKIRLGFVVAEFNRDITYQMEILAKEHAAFLGADVVKTIYVPGVFDMPLAIKNLALDDEVDAVVTIGCVIEGATTHDEIVAQHATRKIADLAANLRREGRDIISFSQGEPDFDTPENIKNAAKDALDRGETHYTQGSGILELREAIAEKLKTDNRLDVTSSDVLVTTGAKQAIFEAICTLIDEGDEVLLFDPAWVSYEPIVK